MWGYGCSPPLGLHLLTWGHFLGHTRMGSWGKVNLSALHPLSAASEGPPRPTVTPSGDDPFEMLSSLPRSQHDRSPSRSPGPFLPLG